VRDSYMRGQGSMYGSIATLMPVVDQSATPEMALGALHRYLAEAVWLPTALLPGDGMSWSSIDDQTARATLTDGDNTVSADFHFGSSGEVLAISAERYRDVNGTHVLTPWVVRLRDYQRVRGVMVPLSGEVARPHHLACVRVCPAACHLVVSFSRTRVCVRARNCATGKPVDIPPVLPHLLLELP
jgi:hypothetical protein